MLNVFYRNRQLLSLSIVLVIVWGLSSFLTLPRLEDPEIVPRFASVTTIFPGASAQRVESLVTEVLEDELQDIEEIDEVESGSKLGVSVLAIELKDYVTEVDPVWSRVRSKIEDAIPFLPDEASKPEFEKGGIKASALIAGLSWDLDDAPNYAILYRVFEGLEDRLRAIPGTEKVELFGEPQEEILVEVNQADLSTLGLTAADLSRQLQASDAKISAGNLRSDRGEYLFEVDSQLDSLTRIEQTPIQLGGEGQVTQLQDFAEISKGIQEPLESLTLVNGKPGLILSATVESQERVDQWAALAKDELAMFETQLSDGMSLEIIQDQSQYVGQRLNGVIANLLVSSLLVIAITFFLLGWRSSLIVGTALPLVTMMVFGLMKMLGIPLHQMSITGLIISLGLLIDNAIIVVDEVQTRLRAQMKPAIAVKQTVQHLGIPLLASTLTTVFAFFPIATSSGATGEFIGTIGLTVILALLSSLGASLTIIVTLAAILGSKTFGRDAPSKTWPRWLTGLQNTLNDGFSNRTLAGWFSRSLRFSLGKPVLGILLGLLLPIVGFSQFMTLEQQFFPPTNRDQIEIEVEMPTSTAIAQTQDIATQIRAAMIESPAVEEVQWIIGESAPPFFYNILGSRRNASDYAQGIVKLAITQNQSQTIQSLQAMLDEAFPQAQILVKQLEQGPPFDAPIEIEVFGPDMGVLRDLGNQLRVLLAQNPDIVQTRAALTESQPKLALTVDEEEARRAGLSNAAIAQQLNASLEGNIGGSLLESTEDIAIRVRVSDQSRGDLAAVASLNLIGSGQNGARNSVPLDAIAQVNLIPDLATINRRDGQRFNTVEGYLKAGALPDTVLKNFQATLEKSDFQLPQGYTLSYGGEANARGTAVGNLLSTVGILMILMTATLVLSFNSFLLAALIGCIAVLSIGLGAFALWMFQSIFGFTAILGMLGLIGLAINDSIVVLAALRDDKQARRGNAIAIERVVFKSTRHVIATTVTTIIGLVPLMFDSTGFWPPLAITIAGGLIGATILALYFVPCAYVLLYRRSSRSKSRPRSEELVIL